MDYHSKLEIMREWCQTAFDTEEEICLYLDISIEDIINCFPDALVKAYSKTFPPATGEDDDEDDEESEGWNDLYLDEKD